MGTGRQALPAPGGMTCTCSICPLMQAFLLWNTSVFFLCHWRVDSFFKLVLRALIKESQLRHQKWVIGQCWLLSIKRIFLWGDNLPKNSLLLRDFYKMLLSYFDFYQRVFFIKNIFVDKKTVTILNSTMVGLEFLRLNRFF